MTRPHRIGDLVRRSFISKGRPDALGVVLSIAWGKHKIYLVREDGIVVPDKIEYGYQFEYLAGDP
jgi:hypothetical protein